MKSAAKTVPEYLASLPAERRKVIATVRRAMKASMPKGYVEAMNWGAICYEVPLKVFPDTYNGQPLLYASLAAQKNNYAIYLMSIYGSEKLAKRLKEGFAAIGKKPDVGKSCIRFKKLEDIPLDTIGEIISTLPVAAWVEIAQNARRRS
ncbi:MAG: DUF1801 domain-containing protein [Gemmatimonadaceae bacterium]